MGQRKCNRKSTRIRKYFWRWGHFTKLSKDRLMFLYQSVLLSFVKIFSITLLLPISEWCWATFQKFARETTHPLLFLLAVCFWGHGEGLKEKKIWKQVAESRDFIGWSELLYMVSGIRTVPRWSFLRLAVFRRNFPKSHLISVVKKWLVWTKSI